MTFQELLQHIRAQAFSERGKGDLFERAMRGFLKTYPLYESAFREVWLWNDFPYRSALSSKDTGIDLAALTFDGEYWAVQCKCYQEDRYIDKAEVDSFLSLSGKSFSAPTDTSPTDKPEVFRFSKRLWLSTTNRWTSDAENTIKDQSPEVLRLNLVDLEAAPVDWELLIKGDIGAKARKAKKRLRAHQAEAVEKVLEHFKLNDRAKLIMACGTGKTFTSLKIAENIGVEQNKGRVVLFLTPSIALLAQTLREWAGDAELALTPICICSDAGVSKKSLEEDASILDLALPASTDAENIVKQFKRAQAGQKEGLIVFFSTYQSIGVVQAAQRELAFEFDIIICDEAHRTTGITLKGEESSAFVKVHSIDNIRAKKRLYMTATPRLYHENSKTKAIEKEAVLASMDDEAVYGAEAHRIGFGEAVDRKLLSDYKVFVFVLDGAAELQDFLSQGETEISTDDVSKLIGCINALSKRSSSTADLIRFSDPKPMRRAVMFCPTIKASMAAARTFEKYKGEYYAKFPPDIKALLVSAEAHHIDGSMGMPKRSGELAWLKSVDIEKNECRILTNVRCLTEGIDVPTLDAVIFLSAKNSEIDVVQAVGRVMRTAHDKEYGYIIIPVIIPSDIAPEHALEDNARYKTLWSVLNALRAHDDRFDVFINKINLNIVKNPPNALRGDGSDEAGDDGGGDSRIIISLPPRVQFVQNAIYARMVEKVGNKQYWDRWAKDVTVIAEGYTARIRGLIAQDGQHRDAFNKFLTSLQEALNPSVDEAAAVEMLAQHYITKPVFEALFENYSFVESNPVSKALQGIVNILEELEEDRLKLTRFYESVRRRVEGIKSPKAKQAVITELYDKFFDAAFKKTTEKLGIVYTPVEIVDFINLSVAKIIKQEFNRSLSDEGVHILDPFTGTGTFIARLIESSLIEAAALPRKYKQEIHANEIVLLAYYIASVNIENAYHDACAQQAQGGYLPFDGVCFTDTFQLGEKEHSEIAYSQTLSGNFDRIIDQKAASIQVIIGNPPYSAGQKSANDDAKNEKYELLDARIAEHYAKGANAQNKNSLYDSYIRAFRWSTDRLRGQDGIIAFVT
ncbi:MAG: DEAD/DEAH box helicase family protein, partial [Deferribacteraceae bacterium]|nr:DEAD/DEAH box helicase family protein [Deferribacteraceae bacterium]